jgi:23S rRNA (pseudouridine1915-N3)-methyltransferase
VDEYARRLQHYVKLELLELPEASSRKLPAGEARRLEGEAILDKVGPRDWLVALDERGKALDSVELSRFVAKAQGQAKDLLFVIGGDEGLSQEVVGAAALTLSLSRMTLPHRLARLDPFGPTGHQKRSPNSRHPSPTELQCRWDFPPR